MQILILLMASTVAFGGDSDCVSKLRKLYALEHGKMVKEAASLVPGLTDFASAIRSEFKSYELEQIRKEAEEIEALKDRQDEATKSRLLLTRVSLRVGLRQRISTLRDTLSKISCTFNKHDSWAGNDAFKGIFQSGLNGACRKEDDGVQIMSRKGYSPYFARTLRRDTVEGTAIYACAFSSVPNDIAGCATVDLLKGTDPEVTAESAVTHPAAEAAYRSLNPKHARIVYTMTEQAFIDLAIAQSMCKGDASKPTAAANKTTNNNGNSNIVPTQSLRFNPDGTVEVVESQAPSSKDQ